MIETMASPLFYICHFFQGNKAQCLKMVGAQIMLALWLDFKSCS